MVVRVAELFAGVGGFRLGFEGFPRAQEMILSRLFGATNGNLQQRNNTLPKSTSNDGK